MGYAAISRRLDMGLYSPARVISLLESMEEGGGSFQDFSTGYLSSNSIPRYFTAATSSRGLVGTTAGMKPLLVYSNAMREPSGRGRGRKRPVSALLMTSIFLESLS